MRLDELDWSPIISTGGRLVRYTSPRKDIWIWSEHDGSYTFVVGGPRIERTSVVDAFVAQCLLYELLNPVTQEGNHADDSNAGVCVDATAGEAVGGNQSVTGL